MDSNYFVMRDQYIFICYKDIIKMTYPVMLKELIDNYYDDLSPYLDLDKIKDFDIYNLERLCVERITKNPLTYIKKPECNFVLHLRFTKQMVCLFLSLIIANISYHNIN